MPQTKIFFTSDIHGSERVFMKFVNSGKFYEANVLVLGGDLTGKVVVPIVEQGGEAYSARFLGQDMILSTKEELENLMKKIRYTGYYPLVTSSRNAEELSADKKKLDAVFSQLMVERLKSWIKIAEERLGSSGIKCYVMPGNDDRPEIAEALEGSSAVVNPEGKVVKIDPLHEMISLGFSNVTPWSAPRDIADQELGQKIEDMVSSVVDMENCIFNLHCPPFDSGLDSAPKLDQDLKPKLDGQLVPVGSPAVRSAIEKYKPLVGLHGHVHESRGFKKIGKTLCVNPGSEYSEGILRGALIILDDRKVKTFMLTSG